MFFFIKNVEKTYLHWKGPVGQEGANYGFLRENLRPTLPLVPLVPMIHFKIFQHF
jgi:hypothetical protein